MGCNCGKSRTSALQKTKAVSSSVLKAKTVPSAVCMNKYDELAILDRKIISLHKKFRLVGEVSKRYADMQKTVRKWIVGLKEGCPDQSDLTELSDYVNSEYDKYFTSK